MASPSFTTPLDFVELELKAGFFFLLVILFVFAMGDPVILGGILLSVAAHEVGHLIPALLTGTRIKAVGANFMGCYIRRARAAGITEKIICLGGPAATLLCAIFTVGMVSRFNWFLFMAVMLPLPRTDFSNALHA